MYLEQKQKPALKAENTTDLPKLYRCLLYVGIFFFFFFFFVFHNLEPQNAGLVDVKRDVN